MHPPAVVDRVMNGVRIRDLNRQQIKRDVLNDRTLRDKLCCSARTCEKWPCVYVR